MCPIVPSLNFHTLHGTHNLIHSHARCYTGTPPIFLLYSVTAPFETIGSCRQKSSIKFLLPPSAFFNTGQILKLQEGSTTFARSLADSIFLCTAYSKWTFRKIWFANLTTLAEANLTVHCQHSLQGPVSVDSYRLYRLMF